MVSFQSKAFLILLLISNVYATFTVNISPEELQNMGEILVQNYMENNLFYKTSLSKYACTFVKKIFINAIHYVALTATLMAANILSPVFQPIVTTLIGSNGIYVNTTTPAIVCSSAKSPSQMCGGHHFGFNHHLCWRSCEINGQIGSCYTKSNVLIRDYHQCTHLSECSACWECLGPCHQKL